MKKATVLLLCLITSPALSTTIDFEEFPLTPGSLGTIFFDGFSSQGYRFSGDHADPSPPAIITTHGFIGTAGPAALGNVALSIAAPDSFISMESLSPSTPLFSLESIWVKDPAQMTVTGYALDGGGDFVELDSVLVSELTTATIDGVTAYLFGASWQNLARVDFTATVGTMGQPGIDNIVVTAVPLPAAVWLFGSALGMLGWIRKRQAV